MKGKCLLPCALISKCAASCVPALQSQIRLLNHSLITLDNGNYYNTFGYWPQVSKIGRNLRTRNRAAIVILKQYLRQVILVVLMAFFHLEVVKLPSVTYMLIFWTGWCVHSFSVTANIARLKIFLTVLLFQCYRN